MGASAALASPGKQEDLCFDSGQAVWAQSIRWSRGSVFPFLGYKLQGAGTKGSFPPPIHPPGLEEPHNALGPLVCVLALSSTFTIPFLQIKLIQEEGGLAPSISAFYNPIRPIHKMEVMNDII